MSEGSGVHLEPRVAVLPADRGPDGMSPSAGRLVAASCTGMMLIFLRSSASDDGVITTAVTDIILVEGPTSGYATRFAKIKDSNLVVVPWYAIDADPEDFGRRLLTVAAADPVCLAVVARATEVWASTPRSKAMPFARAPSRLITSSSSRTG